MNNHLKIPITEDKEIILEINKLARLADNSCLVRYADTVVLVTLATQNRTQEENINFLPLLVEYQEKSYAVGKIPGGFIKREGKPSDKEIITARLIDRAIRSLFDNNYRNDIHIIATVLSADETASLEICSLMGAIGVLYSSKLPFYTPCGAVRVGLVNNNFIINPTAKELKESPLDLIVAGSDDKFTMIELGAHNLPEEIIISALEEANKVIKRISGVLEENIKNEEKEQVVEEIEEIEGLKEFIEESLKKVIYVEDKLTRNRGIDKVREEALARFVEITPNKLDYLFEKHLKELVRRSILEEERRVDGRKLNQLREISCQVGILPRVHGSALFTRGQTQALVTTTLGMSEDEQLIDTIEKREYKQFMLHYYFLPFSVSEVKPLRAPARREIGHGMLAERALLPVLPSQDEFPYTIRIVSDILESNGSTSMATVCGATLSLLDAGVKIKDKVAGVSIGLVKEEENYKLLTDIIGLEDEYGDMDFKIAGTDKGITALQLDTKIKGVDIKIIKEALYAAKDARNFILEKMNSTISAPRKSLSKYAPRIITTQVDVEKIKDIIGPAGKTIKNIIDETGVKLEIKENGKIKISGSSEAACLQALGMIEYLTLDAQVGKIYLGKVLRITHFGAFVEILPGKEGLIHISQLDNKRINNVKDVLQEGDSVLVKLINIDERGRLFLSRKAVLEEQEQLKG